MRFECLKSREKARPVVRGAMWGCRAPVILILSFCLFCFWDSACFQPGLALAVWLRLPSVMLAPSFRLKKWHARSFHSFSGSCSPGQPESKLTEKYKECDDVSLGNKQDLFLPSDCFSSERTMDLVLEMCNTNSIHWCGISGRQLGKLHPSSSLCLALTLLSSVQGLQVRFLLSNQRGGLNYHLW